VCKTSARRRATPTATNANTTTMNTATAISTARRSLATGAENRLIAGDGWSLVGIRAVQATALSSA
jgi:hypothetical protein